MILRDGATPGPEISVVLPCLNEADTLASCIERAQAAFREHGITGEILVADNGSTDGSPEIAERLGARLVRIEQRGYGRALRGGISAARGRFILMGDADASYDFAEIPRFVDKWREGCDLVQGCRLPSGGGRILSGAMPPLHRWWGNPMFSSMARRWFRAPVHDVYCGLRGFTRELYDGLDLRCAGMEFAVEMVLKASLRGARIGEVPITLHPDGRKTHAPHLKTFRDGWRTLRLFLMLSPRRLFLFPAGILIVVGLLGYAVAWPSLAWGGLRFGPHTLLVSSLFLLCGHQALFFALFTKTYAVVEGLLPPDPRLDRLYRVFTLEKGLVAAALAASTGCIFLLVALDRWRRSGWGPLDYEQTLRIVIPGVTLTALGVQTVFSSFFISILGMGRR